MMHWILHSRFRIASVAACLAIALCIPRSLWAQADTTTHQLMEVVKVEVRKTAKFYAGKKVQIFDSATMAMYNTTSLGDLLANQSSIHIKSYGNGNIATPSFRGGNANQTAVVWNGINIQNNMLGQSDLSLVNAFLFDNISVEYGGSSALWGSGAMSGAILLGNKPAFNQGVQTKIASALGSFGTNKLNSSVLLSYKRLVSNTKVYYTASDNNYKYKDTTDKQNPDKQVAHANYVFKGFMQDFSLLGKKYSKINLHAWYNEADRNLPSYQPTVSKASQFDQNLRFNGDWLYNRNKYSMALRGAYLYDVLNYADSLAGIYSKSNIKTTIVENEHFYRLHAHLLNAGVNYTGYQARTQDYTGMKQVNKLALFLLYRWHDPKDRLTVNASVRQEFSSLFKVPLTGNLGAEYKLTQSVLLKLSGARSFRQPTLNDLYWNPGGNPGLKPEDAIGFEGSIAYQKTIGKAEVYFEGTYFNRHTNNWIIWLPQGGSLFTPRNIAQVYSRGTETNFYLKYTTGEASLKLFGSSAYVLSTNQKTINENDQSKDRQLIYTPRYSLQGGLLLSYANISLMYNHTYTGYRFTATDNSSWLDPYNIASVKASYFMEIGKVKLQVNLAINNLFNQNYQVVQNRPMPLRYYEAGLAISYNSKAKNK